MGFGFECYVVVYLVWGMGGVLMSVVGVFLLEGFLVVVGDFGVGFG